MAAGCCTFCGISISRFKTSGITELAESGAPDSVIQSLAGHLSRRMMDHYTHTRLAAKREAVDALAGGLIEEGHTSKGSRHNQVQQGSSATAND